MAPRVTFVLSPKLLPSGKKLGRTALVDLAFAHGGFYSEVTRPFILTMGERLVAWIDHHEHASWPLFQNDPRFVLVEKARAPACPELVTPELVARLGPLDDLLAHADFDGCVAAAKVLRAGETPYAEADEDARAIDAPGRGHVCSPRGERLAFAIDRARDRLSANALRRFLEEVCAVLVQGREPDAWRQQVDAWSAEQRERLRELETWVAAATRPHPDVLWVSLPSHASVPDRKAVLRRLQELARVGVVDDGEKVTIATYDLARLDLRDLCGLEGSAGFVWGRARKDDVLAALEARFAAPRG